MSSLQQELATWEFFPRNHVVAEHDFVKAIEQIKQDIPASGQMDAALAIIKNTLATIVSQFSPFVANGFITKENAPGGDFVDYILAGYDGGKPKIYRVSIRFDWENKKLIGPFTDVMHPRSNRPEDAAIYFFGISEAINRAKDPGPENDAAQQRYPGVIKGLEKTRGSLPITTDEGIVIASDLVRLEAEFSPVKVGPPINIIVISPTKVPVLRSLPK